MHIRTLFFSIFNDCQRQNMSFVSTVIGSTDHQLKIWKLHGSNQVNPFNGFTWIWHNRNYQKYNNRCTFSSCDFPGVLEEEKRLAGAPLGLHGVSGQYHIMGFQVNTIGYHGVSRWDQVESKGISWDCVGCYETVDKSTDAVLMPHFRMKKNVQGPSLLQRRPTWRKTQSQGCENLLSQKQ